MATTSTLVVARAALVNALDTGDLAGKVHYAWPGPEIARNAHEVVWVDRVTDWTRSIPNIKAGRKQRQESFTLELVLWVAKPELTAAGAQAADTRALSLLAVVEDALADDVQLGETRVQWMELGDTSIDSIPLERGWGTQIVASVQGNARLT